MSDGVFLAILDDEDSEEWRLDVCNVALMWNDGVGSEIDVRSDGWMVDVLQVVRSG